MSFVTMADEITLESLTEEQFECFIEYYHEIYLEDFKSDLENLEEIYKMMNGGVEYPRTHSTSPSQTYAPYKPSPSSLTMTHKLDDMIELPKSQSKKTYKEELEYEIVMVKIPKFMSWLDAYEEPIGDIEDKEDNPSP
ncbi:hypothetical protein Tco_1313385 [Tanacetum coccineum]